MMKTEELIKELAEETQAVEPLKPLGQRFLLSVLPALLCVLAAIAMMGLRPDFPKLVNSPMFILQCLVILLAALSSTLSALQLSIPGDQTAFGKKLPFITVLSWVALLSLEGISNQNFGQLSTLLDGSPCMAMIYQIGILPGILLFLTIRRAAPLNKLLTGIFTGLAAVLFGAFAMQFICSHTEIAHMMLWHVLPVLALGLLASFLSRFIFNWADT